MAIDNEQEAADNAEFLAAFDAEAGGDSTAASDTVGEGGPGLDAIAAEAEADAAGGDVEAGAGAGAGADDTVVVEGESPIDDLGDGQATSGVEAEPGAAAEGSGGVAEGGDDLEIDDPAERQRAKSWEGRLKAKEAELKAREDALAGKSTEQKVDIVEEAADAAKDPAMAAAVGDAAAAIEAGEIDVNAAVAQLSEDFGEDFVRLIKAIAKSTANEGVGELRGAMDGFRKEYEEDVTNIAGRFNREHVEAVEDAHPDVAEVAGSDEFRQWVEAQGRADILKNGSARQSIKLLNDYKAARGNAGADEAAAAAGVVPVVGASEEEFQAAAAVPRRGVAVPPRPRAQAADDDYAGAFEEATRQG